MEGLLLVDKPVGWTSFDVVTYVRKIIAQAEGKKPKHIKVGHTGTLDPFATGLLVLLIGKDYTRQATKLTKLDKTYEVTMRLGEISSTGDPEGEIMPLASAQTPTKEALEAAVASFVGAIQQVPPAHSAVKIGGKRAYKLARAGKQVELEPRKITVHSLQLVQYTYPEVKFTAEVSSGTYVRTLVEDIGGKLGTGAYTTALCRTQIGQFSLKDALNINKSLKIKDLQPALLQTL